MGRRRTSIVASALGGGTPRPVADLAAIERSLHSRSDDPPREPRTAASEVVRSFSHAGQVRVPVPSVVPRRARPELRRVRQADPVESELPFQVEPFELAPRGRTGLRPASEPSPAPWPRPSDRPSVRPVPPLADDEIDADLVAGGEAPSPGVQRSRGASPEALEFLTEAKELAPKPAFTPPQQRGEEGEAESEPPTSRAAEHPHAVFERLGQSMSASTSYDLGELSLARRFDAWDAEDDAPASATRRSKPQPAAELSDEEVDADLADLAPPSDATPDVSPADDGQSEPNDPDGQAADAHDDRTPATTETTSDTEDGNGPRSPEAADTQPAAPALEEEQHDG